MGRPGAIAIADQRNNRVRLVDTGGTISTPAAVQFPDGLSAAPGGGVLVVPSAANRSCTSTGPAP